MKRYSFLQLLFVCTGIFFLFGSFTSVFEETPFMKAVLDNSSANAEKFTKTSLPLVKAHAFQENDIDNLLTRWKSVFIRGINKAENDMGNRSKLMQQKQEAIVNLLMECNEKLSQINSGIQSSKSVQQIKDTRLKLAEAIKLVNQIDEQEAGAAS